MNIFVRKAFLALMFFGISSCVTSRSSGILITNVEILDLELGKSIAHQDVLIENGVITNISSVQLERQDFQVIDGTGKTLVPSFWDMHTHFRSHSTQEWLPLFIANGVTHIRDMGLSHPKLITDLKAEIASNDLIGPQVFSSMVMIEGGDPRFSNSVSVTSVSKVPMIMDGLLKDGASLIKLSHNLDPAVFNAIIQYAKYRKVPTAGHIPSGVSVEQASHWGLTSIEHFWGVTDYLEDEIEFNQLAETFKRNGSYHCPTLVGGAMYWPLLDGKASLETWQTSLEENPNLEYAPAHFKAWWQGIVQGEIKFNSYDFDKKSDDFQKQKQAMSLLSQKGVRFLVGTDTPNPYAVPGFSVHDEMHKLVEAGLTPLEVLRSASWYPAMYFQIEDKVGLIKEGFEANLVLLDSNPLQNIEVTTEIFGVFKQGHYFSRGVLNSLLSQVKSSMSAYDTHDFDQKIYMSLRNRSLSEVKAKLTNKLEKPSSPDHLFRLALHLFRTGIRYGNKQMIEKSHDLILWNLAFFPSHDLSMQLKRELTQQSRKGGYSIRE